ncbi:LacI family DNA-binding transcriptional regulator [Crossiella sp. SN42]|uniref:LacI family DNA-binding transcriptional regulator n=1 Tax=Crossiella sp. SN42 TaxID=2944808 RepID=UPI00207CF28E|nr:LacI family DNA-binding transcriptional regulator [Crossiella sp. SN42]MCO1574680.1 LacI family DNA-binding transcriptional regulator [Crossiella sp. SN42]
MSSPGSPRVTMAAVARRAGVSPMTVSYCYSQPDRVAPDTLRRVREAAAELGYQGPDPTARSLRKRHNDAIGVVLGEHLAYAFEDPQARRFLTGVAEVCRERGSGLNLIPTTGADQDVERVRSAAVDGYIVWTTVQDDPVLEVVRGLGKPVAIHGGPAVPGVQVVGIDNRASARDIAARTFAGAQRPAVLSFPFDRERRPRLETGPEADQVPFPVTRERLQGVYDHCERAGLDPRGLPVAVVARNDREEAAAVAALLFDFRTPDAVVAMSDQLAFAVLDAARARGLRVPEDLAVSGWDDGPEAERAGLTTIAQSLHDQGRTCALIALGDRAPGGSASWTTRVRSSTR